MMGGLVCKIAIENFAVYFWVNQKENNPQNAEERLYFVETNLATRRANKPDGQAWLQHSFSIWRDIAKNQEETKLKHPAIFPIQFSERIIDVLTNGSGKNVLDCFAGSGSTLIAGLKKSMNVYGVDISGEFQKLFFNRMNNHDPPLSVVLLFHREGNLPLPDRQPPPVSGLYWPVESDRLKSVFLQKCILL
jgi:DNA modification methylase